jgi:hypothetical protein
MDDTRVVIVTVKDVATSMPDGGIMRITGTDADGNRVTFAGDIRPMTVLLENLTYGEEPEVEVYVEEYQILSIEPSLMGGTDEMLELMMHLDNGSSMFGSLSLDARARIFALVDNPDQETWTNAFGIIVSGTDLHKMPTTLWGALTRHSDYQVISRDRSKPWSEIPTRDQILTALKAVLS